VTSNLGARRQAPYPEATLSATSRRWAYASADCNDASAALSKNLLTHCFFSGYPFLRHVDEAADFSPGDTARCLRDRGAANTFLLAAQVGNLLALREVKQREPRGWAQRPSMPMRGCRALVAVSQIDEARRQVRQVERNSPEGKHDELTRLESFVACRGSYVRSCY
jgi:hypothetical protein